mmetsp:Transcript_9163/g.27514  ORF Transcript_9163/g.27514 Transcript_9163/m.27514 type:complete len:215 (-) Transcript_9163:1462-2106(-)
MQHFKAETTSHPQRIVPLAAIRNFRLFTMRAAPVEVLALAALQVQVYFNRLRPSTLWQRPLPVASLLAAVSLARLLDPQHQFHCQCRHHCALDCQYLVPWCHQWGLAVSRCQPGGISCQHRPQPPAAACQVQLQMLQMAACHLGRLHAHPQLESQHSHFSSLPHSQCPHHCLPDPRHLALFQVVSKRRRDCHHIVQLLMIRLKGICSQMAQPCP